MFVSIVEKAIHQEGTHKVEFSALKRFGEHISPHLVSKTVLEIKFATVVKMLDKEIFGFDMFKLFGAGNIAIFG